LTGLFFAASDTTHGKQMQRKKLLNAALASRRKKLFFGK